MEEIRFLYEMTPEIFMEGAKLSGRYTISPKRKTLIYVLCAVIAVNAVYSMISAGKPIRGQIIFLLIAAGIAFYVAFGTKLQLKRLVKTGLKTGTTEVVLSPQKITVRLEDQTTEVEKAKFGGFLENEKVYLVAIGTGYVILPKDGKTKEELSRVTEILKNYRKTVAPPEPEFPIFNAETAVGDDEEAKKTEAQEEAKGESSKGEETAKVANSGEAATEETAIEKTASEKAATEKNAPESQTDEEKETNPEKTETQETINENAEENRE